MSTDQMEIYHEPNQAQADEHTRCDGARDDPYCGGMRSFMDEANAHKAGISPVVLTRIRNRDTTPEWAARAPAVLVAHFDKTKEYVFGIALKRSAKDKGVFLNFCPFCGSDLEKAWLHPFPFQDPSLEK